MNKKDDLQHTEEKFVSSKLWLEQIQNQNVNPFVFAEDRANYLTPALTGYIFERDIVNTPYVIGPTTEINDATSVEESRHMEVVSKLNDILKNQDTQSQRIAEIKELIRTGNLTIIDCIKFNATKNIQLICLFSILITLFSIITSAVLRIHFLNPFFAILMLVVSVGFFIMTKVQEKMEKASKIRGHD